MNCKVCLALLVLGVAIMVPQFRCNKYQDDVVIPPTTYVEKHLVFFQGNEHNTNYVCFSPFVARLQQLGLGWKSYVIAAAIMKVGGDKTNDSPRPWWQFVGPLCVYRPNILRMIHAPADTGMYQANGSIANSTTVFEHVYEVDGDGHKFITKERMLDFIKKRNGCNDLSAIQKGEYEATYESLKYFVDKGTRKYPYLYESDIIALYEGNLFYNLVGETPPWK